LVWAAAFRASEESSRHRKVDLEIERKVNTIDRKFMVRIT
jgi:hypothetical protein